jgi:hypothetical protein
VRVEFRILGPLEVLDAQGRPLALGGPKQRALLGLAAARRPAGGGGAAGRRAVGGGPARHGSPQPGDVCGHLRKVLEPDRPRRSAGEVLRTQLPGYLIDLGSDELDLMGFERLASQGRAALAAGDPAGTARLLGDAVGLWRGPALADPGWPAARARWSGWRSAGWPPWRTRSRPSWPWAATASSSASCRRWWLPIRCGSACMGG